MHNTLNFLRRKATLMLRIVPYLSFRKTANLCRLLFSYMLSFAGIEWHRKSMPFFLSVEVTNYCNLHCPDCFVGSKKYAPMEQADFDGTVFKKLMDELKPTLQHVILYFQGEPLLNKQLAELIDYAHRAKVYTATSTNAQFLTIDTAKLLVLSGLDKLIVSMDGSTQESYEKYRVGGKLEKVIEGIRHINYWKSEFNSITPMVEIQFIVLKSNEHQLDEMRTLSNSLKADRLVFKTAQHDDVEDGNERMTTKNRYARYKKTSAGKYVIKGRQPNRCWRLWSGAVVNVAGEVLPCCFDKGSEHSFGNITQQSFSTCWHNTTASVFRKQILQHRKRFRMCSNCNN